MPTQNPATPADDPRQYTLITLGFTQSDRTRDYSSFTDGYQLGARQIAVTVTVDARGIDLAPEVWAEAVFIASNDPNPPADPASALERAEAAVRHALTTQVRFPIRSFSVGDTATVGGVMLACQPVGWLPVADLPHPDNPTASDVEKR